MRYFAHLAAAALTRWLEAAGFANVRAGIAYRIRKAQADGSTRDYPVMLATARRPGKPWAAWPADSGNPSPGARPDGPGRRVVGGPACLYLPCRYTATAETLLELLRAFPNRATALPAG